MTSQPLSKPLQEMKKAGIWEGISYILLLFIAMPMKYVFDIPEAVRIVGTLHGILFILFMYCIYNAMSKGGLSLSKAVVAFVASLIPFGTFYLDRLVFRC
jgi:integral membrane protein